MAQARAAPVRQEESPGDELSFQTRRFAGPPDDFLEQIPGDPVFLLPVVLTGIDAGTRVRGWPRATSTAAGRTEVAETAPVDEASQSIDGGRGGDDSASNRWLLRGRGRRPVGRNRPCGRQTQLPIDERDVIGLTGQLRGKNLGLGEGQDLVADRQASGDLRRRKIEG